MIDTPARQGFYEGVYETYEQGYSLTAISDATGLSVPKVQRIVWAERARRLRRCAMCHGDASKFIRGMIDDRTMAEDGLFTCDEHEDFLARGIVFGNGYMGLHAMVLSNERST